MNQKEGRKGWRKRKKSIIDESVRWSRIRATQPDLPRLAMVWALILLGCSPVRSQISFPTAPSIVFVPTPILPTAPVVAPALQNVAPSAQPTLTVAPSSGPSISPTISKVPSIRPTTKPTSVPTRLPTKVPSYLPTEQPSLAPSRLPTSMPSILPTAYPTNLPTHLPTNLPTNLPTSLPTSLPTRQPTRTPSEIPSSTPSSGPTRSPTGRPTLRPSANPSATPSWDPTQLPTTPLPSSLPSLWPSLEPTPETAEPSNSLSPSQIPSQRPSEFPSEQPSQVPSSVPSILPSNIPSEIPSVQPSLPLLRSEVDVVMFIASIEGLLRGRPAIDFEASTSAHIAQTTKNDGYDIVDLSVDTTILQQNNQVDVSNTSPSDGRGLQLNLTPLRVGLSILVEYRSVSLNETYSPADWIREAFNSIEEREVYKERLKQKNAAFEFLETVSLLVDGAAPIEEANQPIPSSGGNGTLGIIVGVVVGAFFGLALAAIFFTRRGKVSERYTAAPKTNTTASPRMAIQTEIVVERQDPVFSGGMDMQSVERDERTASVSDDYDYAKEYLLGQHTRDRGAFVDSGPSGKTSGIFSRVGSGPMVASVFADDVSFEQHNGEDDDENEENKFEVDVPPGKLGMVIDTPNGGVPIVHAIKPESVLVDKVVVGDRLMSVDGDDVTSMTAVQVSKLISIKSSKERKLVFTRSNNVIDTLAN